MQLICVLLVTMISRNYDSSGNPHRLEDRDNETREEEEKFTSQKAS